MKEQDLFERNDADVLINKNRAAFDKYRLIREKAAREKQLSNKVESLEKELSEIKTLLQSLNSRIK